MVLQDHEGREVRLGDLWGDRPAVLVFLRYYGCAFCREQAVKLSRDQEHFAATGVRLAAIGHGTPEQAAHFRKRRKLEIPVLVDTDRASYEAAGAKIAVLSEIMGPRILARGLKRSIKARVLQGRFSGNPAQLGGVVIVAPDGSVRYAHMAQDASDTPPNEELLAAARAIRPHLRGFAPDGLDGDSEAVQPPALLAASLANASGDGGAVLPKAWTAQELSDFLEHVADDRLYALWLLLSTTGLWPDEALALKWADIDLDEEKISVHSALIPVGKTVMWSELEPGRGRREISIDPPTVVVLRVHQHAQRIAGLVVDPDRAPSSLVFTSEDGSVLDPEEAERPFDELVAAAGVPRIRLIDLRHTHATLALQAGVPPEVVSQRLGHRSVARTVEAYAHAIPSDDELERHLAALAERRA
jgi:integrase